MIRRQNNNQWSGGIAAYPVVPQKITKSKIRWKSSRFDFYCAQNGILLIGYLPKGQTIKAEYYLSLLVQMKDNLKENCHGKFTKGVLVLHEKAPARQALAT
jgi:hypothetical protein